jgi:hypothetical protein
VTRESSESGKIFSLVTLYILYFYDLTTYERNLREEHRLSVFEKRVLRRIFGPEREVDGSWRKLHNDEDEVGGTCGTHGGGRGVCRVFVGKPEGKRPLGRHRHRREDNIKMDRLVSKRPTSQ